MVAYSVWQRQPERIGAGNGVCRANTPGRGLGGSCLVHLDYVVDAQDSKYLGLRRGAQRNESLAWNLRACVEGLGAVVSTWWGDRFERKRAYIQQ